MQIVQNTETCEELQIVIKKNCYDAEIQMTSSVNELKKYTAIIYTWTRFWQIKKITIK